MIVNNYKKIIVSQEHHKTITGIVHAHHRNNKGYESFSVSTGVYQSAQYAIAQSISTRCMSI